MVSAPDRTGKGSEAAHYHSQPGCCRGDDEHSVPDQGVRLRRVIHCYSYSPEMAKEYTEMGFYIGVGGVVTFKNAKKLVRTVEEIPIESLVLETDCPYLAPEPNRGKRNDSSQLIYVAEKIAELKGMPVQEVIRITTGNAERLYHLNGGKGNAGNNEGF